MKAVIKLGGKQYIVAENETLLVDHLPEGTKDLTLEPLMVFDENNVSVGAPTVAGATVTVTVTELLVKAQKIHVVKFESKKRVNKMNGHRQQHSRIMVNKITVK